MWLYIAPLLSAAAAAAAVFVAMRNTNRTLAHQTALQGEHRTWERREALYKKMLNLAERFMSKAADVTFPVPNDEINGAEDFFASQFLPEELKEVNSLGTEVELLASDEMRKVWNTWARQATLLVRSSVMARFNNSVLYDDGSTKTTGQAHQEELERAYSIVTEMVAQARHDLHSNGKR